MKQGTNAAVMRQKNEKMILSLINQNPLSRADISKITGLKECNNYPATSTLEKQGN